MRQLTLLRHAKSSWADFDLSDFDRPLNKRGLRNAPDMAARLKARKFLPDLALVSPAKRALETARIILPLIGLSEDRTRFDEEIYEAGTIDLLGLVRTTEDDCGHLLLIGHNPGFTDLWNLLADERILNIPTCGVFSLKFRGLKSWEDLKLHSGKTIFIDYPKKKT